MIRCQPYDGIACIYDRIMNHVHYDEWAPYITSLFRRYKVPVASILEIACGTGSHTRMLVNRGYHVLGIDRSLSMLQAARVKFLADEVKPRFVNADMTAIPLDAAFDAVLCLYDSINYCCENSSFLTALREAARVTRPGGLYVFDVCTVQNSELHFSHRESTETFGDIVCHRTSRFNRSKHLQENTFIIDKDGRNFMEHHVQRIYRIAEIQDMLADTPFEVLDILNDMTFLPGTELSDRVHFVLGKPA